MSPPIVETEPLQPVLRELGMAEAVAVVAMEGGSLPIFRVDLADGTHLVLRTYPDTSAKTPAREAFAAAQLPDIGVPVTRYLLCDESRSRLPFRFALTTYLPGVTAQNLRHHPGIPGVYREMGVLLRRLHAVPMPGYGSFDAHGLADPVGSNAKFLRAVIDRTFERFGHFGGDPVLTESLRAIVEMRFDDVVTHSAGPVFAHDDLQPGNVLVTPAADGTLHVSGLIDFGNAHATDAVYDLAKCLFCSLHHAPDCRTPFMEGYGTVDHPDPAGAIAYYTLLHRMMMWWWLRHIGAIAKPDEPSDLIDDLRVMAAA